MLDLIPIRIVRIAHDPGGAGISRDLALLHHVIDPEADVMDADKILAGALGGLVALEVQDRQIDDPVGQEHPLGERAVEFRHFLQTHRLLVEFSGFPRVFDAQRDVTNAAFGLRGHGQLPGCILNLPPSVGESGRRPKSDPASAGPEVAGAFPLRLESSKFSSLRGAKRSPGLSTQSRNVP